MHGRGRRARQPPLKDPSQMLDLSHGTGLSVVHAHDGPSVRDPVHDGRHLLVSIPVVPIDAPRIPHDNCQAPLPQVLPHALIHRPVGWPEVADRLPGDALECDSRLVDFCPQGVPVLFLPNLGEVLVCVRVQSDGVPLLDHPLDDVGPRGGVCHDDEEGGLDAERGEGVKHLGGVVGIRAVVDRDRHRAVHAVAPIPQVVDRLVVNVGP
mmetsp:Transcript_8270/g.19300  ORF Transcript_8270/g.19300 Transcript_8270/m.19300 type:complete len:209 (-) Transcript_8270:248-874(-)